MLMINESSLSMMKIGLDSTSKHSILERKKEEKKRKKRKERNKRERELK
jgi:hypothetical protein